MNKAEAVLLLDRQKAFLAANGHFAGLAPGVNGAQIRRAERILAGTEIENKPAVPQVFDSSDKPRAIGHGAEVVNGPLLPEVAAKKLAAAASAKAAEVHAEPEAEPEADSEPEAQAESAPQKTTRRGKK